MKTFACLTLFAILCSCSATEFREPHEYSIWQAGNLKAFSFYASGKAKHSPLCPQIGSVAKIHIVGGKTRSADILLFENGGYRPKNLGYVAKDVPLDGEIVMKFKVWDELPPGKKYNLIFNPKLESGPATTAFSHEFTIAP